jgi:hypothetical protein
LTEEDRKALDACTTAIRASISAVLRVEAKVDRIGAELVAVQEALSTLDIHVHQVLDKELRDVALDAAAAVETANNVARENDMQQIERLETQERRERVKTGGE